jgi:hypothetical protein
MQLTAFKNFPNTQAPWNFLSGGDFTSQPCCIGSISDCAGVVVVVCVLKSSVQRLSSPHLTQFTEKQLDWTGSYLAQAEMATLKGIPRWRTYVFYVPKPLIRWGLSNDESQQSLQKEGCSPITYVLAGARSSQHSQPYYFSHLKMKVLIAIKVDSRWKNLCYRHGY